jgi:hypothetical protein
MTAHIELPRVALRVDSLAELPLSKILARVEAAPVPGRE